MLKVGKNLPKPRRTDMKVSLRKAVQREALPGGGGEYNLRTDY